MLTVGLLRGFILFINLCLTNASLKDASELWTAIGSVPTLNIQDEQVNKAIGADRLLLLLDYHGALLDCEKEDRDEVQKLLEKLSEDRSVQVAVISGGPGAEIVANQAVIPRLIKATDLGLKVMYEDILLASPSEETAEEAKRIGGMCTQVIEDLIKSQGKNRDQYMQWLKPYSYREFAYRVHIRNQVDKDFSAELLRIVKIELNRMGLTHWRAHIPNSGKSLIFRLKGANKVNTAVAVVEGSRRIGKPFDYIIGMGDSEQDEDLLAYLNQENSLPILVDNAFHNIAGTAANFRLPDCYAARKLLMHIIDQRKKSAISMNSIEPPSKMMTREDYEGLLYS